MKDNTKSIALKMNNINVKKIQFKEKDFKEHFKLQRKKTMIEKKRNEQKN